MLTIVLFYCYYIIPALTELFSNTLPVLITDYSDHLLLCSLNISTSWWNMGPLQFFLEQSIRLWLQNSLLTYSLSTFPYLKGNKVNLNYSKLESLQDGSFTEEAFHHLLKNVDRRCLHQQKDPHWVYQPLVGQCKMPTAVLPLNATACIL